MAILSFRCKQTEALFEGRETGRFAGIRHVAERKLQQLDSASTLDFLRAPPGNRLEALAGERRGSHSMRINRQFRMCFRWTPDGPEDVEIVDYH